MKKKLTTSGSGWEIYLAKPILKLMGINPKSSQVLFRIEKRELIIKEIKPCELESYQNSMIRKFTKSGSGYALYISNTILELLDINPIEDYIEYELNYNVLTIRKIEN